MAVNSIKDSKYHQYLELEFRTYSIKLNVSYGRAVPRELNLRRFRGSGGVVALNLFREGAKGALQPCACLGELRISSKPLLHQQHQQHQHLLPLLVFTVSTIALIPLLCLLRRYMFSHSWIHSLQLKIINRIHLKPSIMASPSFTTTRPQSPH